MLLTFTNQTNTQSKESQSAINGKVYLELLVYITISHRVTVTLYLDFVLHWPTISSLKVILWGLMLARPLNSIGPSRLWVPLLGTVSHLNSALFHGICPARFTSSLKLSFSPWARSASE